MPHSLALVLSTRSKKRRRTSRTLLEVNHSASHAAGKTCCKPSLYYTNVNRSGVGKVPSAGSLALTGPNTVTDNVIYLQQSSLGRVSLGRVSLPTITSGKRRREEARYRLMKMFVAG